ncbi:MAG: low-specificity L-threonine aldolase [Chloroflexi bacterium]|nr:low-specificity L-threonine aldolase [Chloroflexota bacterium]
MTIQPATPPRIDLRSDTLTQPTPAMREAMANAVVGDDVFGEDPTVNELEAMAAAIMGKEAALFVTSGTQGNLVSLLSHCNRGDEVILGDQSHIYFYEQGGSAAVGGIHPRPVFTLPNGAIPLEVIEAAIRPDNVHFPITRLVCLENTHNRAGGTFLTPEYTDAVAELAHERGVKLHIDGARIFNAAVAQDVDVKELVRGADSVTFCLSKGLSAPVGSLVCGSQDFIRRARRARKVLGGGMRQAGILAAAGIVALNEMVERLADDHANARRLAQGIAHLPGVEVDLDSVQTNILIFELDHPRFTPSQFEAALRERGVGILAIGGKRMRAVTHYGIEAEDIEEAIGIFAELLDDGTKGR